MSKRKRAPGKPADESSESTDDASVKEDMVHVTPDVLAGSPDIFAAKKNDAAPTEPEPEVETEHPAEPTAASTTLTPEPEVPAAAPPPAQPPMSAPFVTAEPYPGKARHFGSSAALGLVLIVVGIFALVIVLAGIDLTQYGWPLFVIIPGLTLLVVGFAGLGQGASIPGGIITMLGLVLAYQNSTNDWASWAYAWALIVPGGVGLGMYLQALRDRDQHALRTGRTLMFVAAMIFVIGFVLFESILGISGRDYGVVGKAALPALLIVIGIILLARSIQRARRA